jgi:hypothetical protein
MKRLEGSRPQARPVGYGMIGCLLDTVLIRDLYTLAPPITPFPTGRFASVKLPGISCLATFMQSLRDKTGFLPFVDACVGARMSAPRDGRLYSIAKMPKEI